MNLTDQELDALKNSKNESEWNATCDQIKSARSGQYPPDWHSKVLATGLIQDAQLGWH